MDGETLSPTIPHRFTVTDFYAMAEAGVFQDHRRVELIHGQVVDMAAIGAPHFRAVTRLTMLLTSLVAGRAEVSVQGPVRLDDYSEPQPDLAVIRPQTGADETSPYFPADVFLLIEVADSSLLYDRRTKTPLYAASGIPEYWIVNLQEQVVEVHRRPDGDRYAETSTHAAGTLAIGALPGVSVSVDGILRRRS